MDWTLAAAGATAIYMAYDLRHDALERVKSVYPISSDYAPARSKSALLNLPSFKFGDLIFWVKDNTEDLAPLGECLNFVPHFVITVMEITTGNVVGSILIEFFPDGKNWLMNILTSGDRFPGPKNCFVLRGSSSAELLKEVKLVLKDFAIALYGAKEEIAIAFTVVVIARAIAYIIPLIVEGAIVGGAGLLPVLIR